MDRLLLCTDMDRTVIPNGYQAEHPDARKRFRELCDLPQVQLVYVTGRHLQLVRQAIDDYRLPMPGCAITDVGTRIYQQTEGQWREILSWQDQIAPDWGGKTHAQLERALAGIEELILQEEVKQNDFKLSYYLPLDVNQKAIAERIESRLTELGVDASLVWSIDEPQQVGLLDLLPRNATKMHGIEFLYQYLGIEREEVIFAGDSGNDLSVLGSSIRSIVVANAELEVKQQALQLAGGNGWPETLYLAREEGPLGGNYAAGVLQGVSHYAPLIVNKVNP